MGVNGKPEFGNRLKIEWFHSFKYQNCVIKNTVTMTQRLSSTSFYTIAAELKWIETIQVWPLRNSTLHKDELRTVTSSCRYQKSGKQFSRHCSMMCSLNLAITIRNTYPNGIKAPCFIGMHWDEIQCRNLHRMHQPYRFSCETEK